MTLINVYQYRMKMIIKVTSEGTSKKRQETVPSLLHDRQKDSYKVNKNFVQFSSGALKSVAT